MTNVCWLVNDDFLIFYLFLKVSIKEPETKKHKSVMFKYQTACISLIGCRQFAAAARPIKKLKNRRPIIVAQRARNLELESEASSKTLEWRVIGAT